MITENMWSKPKLSPLAGYSDRYLEWDLNPLPLNIEVILLIHLGHKQFVFDYNEFNQQFIRPNDVVCFHYQISNAILTLNSINEISIQANRVINISY